MPNVTIGKLNAKAGLYTQSEVAVACGVTLPLFRHHVAKGNIPAPGVSVLWSKRLFYDEATRAAVIEYFARRRKK